MKIIIYHINLYLISHSLGKNVFVEGACEVAFKQLVVVDSLGDDSTHELEVAEVVGVDVGEVVDGVGHPVPGAGLEQGVVGVEDLPGDDDVPLPQQPPGILPLLPLEHDVEPVLPLLRAPPVQISEGIFKHCASPHMNSQVLTSYTFTRYIEIFLKCFEEILLQFYEKIF